jgi:hypothetical protein
MINITFKCQDKKYIKKFTVFITMHHDFLTPIYPSWFFILIYVLAPTNGWGRFDLGDMFL